jgi:hypothetical protein
MNSRRMRFEIHRAQKIAAAFLLIFLLQALWLVAHLPLTMAETRNALAGRALWSQHRLTNAGSVLIPGDSIFALRCAGLLPSLAQPFAGRADSFSVYAAPDRWLLRLPFVIFGVWLGGALWWVSRRLFGDEGGYVSLGLYCVSAPALFATVTVDSAILAAWGLFGLIFTAVGVAHTLYAPARKWRPRILLLGAAIGLTAAANLSAAVAGLILAAVLMLYLAPGRRLIALLLLGSSSVIGAVILLIFFGFDLSEMSAAAIAPNGEYLRFTSHRISTLLLVPGGLIVAVAFLACVVVFLAWRRTRYFGNTAPLIVALLLPWWPGRFLPGASALWALPFAFVFIGGIYSDLLESRFFAGRFRRLVAATAFVIAGASAVFSLMVTLGA